MHNGATAPCEQPRPKDLLRALNGWALAGATVGAFVAALAIRANSSLQGPDQAVPFVLLSMAAYTALFLPVGFVIALVARFAGKVRPSLSESMFAGLIGFGAFALCQFAIGSVNWRGETNALNIASSLVFATIVALAARIALDRWSAYAQRRWVLAPVLALASLLFASTSTRYDSRPDAGGSSMASAEVEVARPEQGPIQRVMLIGVDGADWERLDPLLAAGRLPNFARLCAGGFRAPLETTKPTWSPIVWTTIATGVREERHGVLDFTEVELPLLDHGVQRTYPKYAYDALLPHDVGLVPMFSALVEGEHVSEMPVSAVQRRHKAVWNILSEHGVKCGVVRWWATWPAEQIPGYLLSDNDPLMQVFAASKRANMNANATTSYMTWPPELALDLLELVKADGPIDSSAGAVDKLFANPILADLTDEERTQLRGRPGILEMFEVIFRGDAFANRTALKLWNEKQVEMLAVYLRSVDNMSHRLSQYTGVVDRTYEFVDKLLGELLDAGGANTTYVLVSDHGWCYIPGPTFAHNHGPPGVIIVKGPEVNAQASAQPSVLDVTPTVLALYGLPPASDMTGHALNSLFAAPSPAAQVRTPIASYGAYQPRWPSRTNDSDAGRRQAVDLLRGLGYLK
jgi:hypothetical protein